MRNLKKVLSLVLCMAMMLSVMVIGAGAAFSDQKEIKNTEAVDVCSALNIINGYTDGSFKPEGTITRAEACKMICVALNGGKEPVLGTNATPTFTDIKGHWAEGYIEYCVSEGIVAGVGGGKFNPAGNVTGSQFAKMLLTALGYSADHEKFVGSAWEVNVNVKATQKDLYDELSSMDPAKALTRDNAAQMVWNALQAVEVEYKYTLNGAGGSLTSKAEVVDKTHSVAGTDVPTTMLWDKYGATIGTGIVTAAGHTTKGWTATITGAGSFTKMDSDASEFMGQKVKVVYKATDDVYGIYAHSDTNIIASGIVKDLDTTTVGTDQKFKFDDVEYKTSVNENTIDVVAPDGGAAGTGTLAAFTATAGSKMVLIDNTGDEKVDVAVVTPVTAGKVSFVSSDTITVVAADKTAGAASAAGTIKFDDANVYDGIAKGDFIVVVAGTDLADGKTLVQKADVVSGTVKGTKSGEVKIDDTWYKLDGTTGVTANIDDVVEGINVNGVLYSYKVTDATASGKFLVIQGIETNYGDIQAKVTTEDGNSQVVTINKYSTDGSTYSTATTTAAKTDLNGSPFAGKLYAYKVVDGKYRVTEITNGMATVKSALGYDSAVVGSTTYVSKKINSNPISDDAIVFINDNDGYKVMTGAAVKKWGNSTPAGSSVTGYLASNDGGYAYVKIAYVVFGGGNTEPGASDGTNYGYVVATPYASKLANGDDAVTLSIWNGTEVITVQDKNNTPGLLKHDIVSYTDADNNTIKVTNVANKGTAVSTDWSQIAAMNGKYLKFADENNLMDPNEYKVTDDTVILYVNTKDVEGYADGTISIANKDDAGNLLKDMNAYFIASGTADSDDGAYALKLLVVEVSNKVDF